MAKFALPAKIEASASPHPCYNGWHNFLRISDDLCDWLRDCPNIVKAEPIRICFGSPLHAQHEAYGALYRTAEAAESQIRVLKEGPMKAGETIHDYRMYLLGSLYQKPPRMDKWVGTYDLPDSHRRRIDPCYSRSNEWYVSGYWQDEPGTTPEQRTYHPFGIHFLMRLHEPMNFGPYKNHKIDTGDQFTPYDRIPLSVEYL